jgi:hypothetical protein
MSMMGLPPNSIGIEQEPPKEESAHEEEQEERDCTPFLRALIPDDPKLLVAMEYFLLASPTRQLSQLGDRESLKKARDGARAAGDDMTARIDYESAAKIALYEGDRGAFEDLLSLAEKVTSSRDNFAELHRILLNNVDGALGIADEYYEEMAKGRAQASVANSNPNPSA